jgi:predicted aspartyl protease
MTDVERMTAPFSVGVDLANQIDLLDAKAGRLAPEKVRRVRVRGRGIVDNRVPRLVIPESVARQLGLESAGRIKIRYADGRTAERQMVRLIHLSCGGRESAFSAVVEPDRESVLIGAIVLEDLDFLIDCTAQRLVPRDPKQIVSEAE